ncbi:ABC transporter permease [Agreia pratensis]|uniref:ABC transporter permease n=1 Tax=Agreia pratensis TaxID=150121 RepID=UPI00188D9CD7|nr:ABC transporter permease [Agreia pratensis]MBF4635302.1 ABC transporter permease [Agreia pratensis]
MLQFILRRLGAGILLVWVISTLTFFLTSFTGNDQARTLAGPTATVEAVEAVRVKLGLDRPVLDRYLEWLTGAIRGDLGTSWFTNQPVSRVVEQALPVSLSIVITAILLTTIVSTFVGVLAALRRGWVDRALQTASLITFAVPNFLVGMLLALFFAVELGWLPAGGFTSFTDDPGAWVASITLPALALAIGSIAASAAQTRAAMIEVLRQDYIRTLRSRGLPTWSILLKHALRNAAPSSLTTLSIQFVAMLGGAVVIEKVFGLSGIGKKITSAAVQGDVPVVVGIVVVTVILVVVVNLITDLALGWLNPKVRTN